MAIIKSWNYNASPIKLCIFRPLLALIFIFPLMLSPSYAMTTSEIFQKYSSSVVTIYSLDSGEKIHQGSGFFLEKSGLVLTNYHVVHNSKKILIETSDEQVFDVSKILAQDASKDLALLATAAPVNKITPVLFAHEIPAPGSKVITIGTPVGFSHSISDGILSAVKRGKDGDTIQFTAPISPGSSGSPLFDENGKVIGIVTSQIVDAQNINFAVSKSAIADFIKTRPNINARDAELAQRAKKTDQVYKTAVAGNTIYKAGEYKDTFIYRLSEPFKSTLPGALGIHFWFEFTKPCVFSYSHTSNSGYEVFLPPSDVIASYYAGMSVIVRGDTVGILRNPTNGNLTWFVDNSNYNRPLTTVWTREFKPAEYAKLEAVESVSFDENKVVLLVDYLGYFKDKNEISFLVTDSRNNGSRPVKIYLPLDRLPGFFKLAGGSIDIDRVEFKDNKSVLYYDWDIEPEF